MAFYRIFYCSESLTLFFVITLPRRIYGCCCFVFYHWKFASLKKKREEKICAIGRIYKSKGKGGLWHKHSFNINNVENKETEIPVKDKKMESRFTFLFVYFHMSFIQIRRSFFVSFHFAPWLSHLISKQSLFSTFNPFCFFFDFLFSRSSTDNADGISKNG